MSDEPQSIHLSVVSDIPRYKTMQLFMKVVESPIPVRSVPHLVNTVLAVVAAMGNRKIRKLSIYAHGGRGYFTIVDDFVSAGHADRFPWLSRLAPHFHPEAEVVINACDTGHTIEQTLLKILSQLWGGIKVTAYTGSIEPYTRWILSDGIDRNGDEITCEKQSCTRTKGS